MFQQLETESSFVSWVAQLAISCLAPLIGLACVSFLVDKFVNSFVVSSPFRGPNQDASSAAAADDAWQLLGYIILATVSACLARIVSRFWRNSFREGRFTWIIPATFEAVVLIAVLLSGRGREVYGLFIVTGPGEGTAFAVVLLTYPTFSATVYSATMWWLYRQQSR